MKNKLFRRSAWVTAFLATLVASRVALAVNEVEPNDPYTQAQALTIGSDGTATVTGSIYNLASHRDVDFYSFHGNAGDVVTVDIDGGMDANYNGVWTALGLFGPDNATLSSVYLATSLDPGSVSVQDARIDNFVLPTTGTYIVGVSSMPGYFVDINTLYQGDIYPYSPSIGVQGNYTLIISGVTPEAAPAPTPQPVASALPIGIDIMPGRRNVIWIHSAGANDSSRDADRRRDLAQAIRGHLKGNIPVALLSSDTFNAMDVNQASLRFGSSGDEDSLVRCNPHGIDVNRDGKPDLLCHFDVVKANFEPGDTEGVVTGATNSGDQFEGKGYLKIISGKRDPHGDRDRRGHRHRR